MWRRMRDSESDTEDGYGLSVVDFIFSMMRRGQIRLLDSHPSSDSDSVASSDAGSERQRRKSAGGFMQSDVEELQHSDIATSIKLSSGCCQCKQTDRGAGTQRSMYYRLRNRQLGMNAGALTAGDRCYCASQFQMNNVEGMMRYPSKVFCGQYSKDGDLFIAATQDSRIYVADGRTFAVRNVIHARDVGWSVLDVTVSPDRRHIIYSSWSDYIHQCKVDSGSDDDHVALPLLPSDNRFCVFSLRFSSDGSEILAGASDHCVYVYDREENTKSMQFAAHEDDVNAVTFADCSSHILYSGGDDGFCKVWDRRCLREVRPVPVGVLAGHMDGITFIDSKDDGRYLISNSKDQTIKLWDIRKFSDKGAQKETKDAVANQHWDYRWQSVPKPGVRNRRRLKGDSSVATYRGHTVLHTLIRAFFSPMECTGQRYIYTGCASGKLRIYDLLTGELLPTSFSKHSSCVRDVSWHPYENHICTSSWDGHVKKWYYDGAVAEGDKEPLDLVRESDRPPVLRRSARLASRRQRDTEAEGLHL